MSANNNSQIVCVENKKKFNPADSFPLRDGDLCKITCHEATGRVSIRRTHRGVKPKKRTVSLMKKPPEERIRKSQSIYRSTETVRKILNQYFSPEIINDGHTVWSTLTCQDPIYDYYEFGKMLKNFMKRLERILTKREEHFIYFVVREPHESGAWHAHALFRFDGKLPDDLNEIISDSWKNGIVDVQIADVYSNKNMECPFLNYVTKNFRNHEQKETFLKFYPTGCRPFSWSHELKPEKDPSIVTKYNSSEWGNSYYKRSGLCRSGGKHFSWAYYEYEMCQLSPDILDRIYTQQSAKYMNDVKIVEGMETKKTE